MSIDNKTVRKVSKLAKIRISEQEETKLIEELNNILIREKRDKIYKDCLKFLKTRVELDLAFFKDDIWAH